MILILFKIIYLNEIKYHTFLLHSKHIYQFHSKHTFHIVEYYIIIIIFKIMHFNEIEKLIFSIQFLLKNFNEVRKPIFQSNSKLYFSIKFPLFFLKIQF